MSQIWQVNTLQGGRAKEKVTPCCTPTPPNQCHYKVSTFYTLQNLRNSRDMILKLKVTMTSKVKSRSTPKQCPHQVSLSYTLQFLRYSLEENNTPTALKGCGIKIIANGTDL